MKKIVILVTTVLALSGIFCSVHPAQDLNSEPVQQCEMAASAESIRAKHRGAAVRTIGGRRSVYRALRRTLPRLKRCGRNVRFFVRPAGTTNRCGETNRYFLYFCPVP